MDVSTIIRKVTGIKKQLPTKSIRSKDWLSWYRGKVWGFHNYRIYNGTEFLDLERKSLQMPKMICETWANLLLNERCDIVLPDEDKERLDNIFNATNFWLKGNQGVEQSFAMGLGALVVNVKGIGIGERTGLINKDKTKIKIDFVNETKLHPITIEDKIITECAFVSKNSDTTHVVVHILNDAGNYVIHNYVLNDKDDVIDNYEFDTKSTLPWFQIIRPNISSNFITQTTDEELGVSIFANRIDTFKSIDNKYDGFDWEYILGRKRTFVSTEAWRVDKENGERIRTFDPFDTLFYQLPENDDGKPVITHQDGSLRYDAYIRGINAELNYLSSGVGLGEVYYKFDGSNVATATQVISENSTLYRNIKKHEILLENVLKNITRAVMYANNEFTNNDKFSEIDDNEIVIQFDDTIIEDRNAEMERDRADVTAGIMTKWEYRMKWYGEDEDTAQEKMQEYFLNDEIMKYQDALITGAITPTQFVDIVYPFAKNKEEIIEYITDFISQQSQMDMSELYAGDETGIPVEDDDEDDTTEEE